MKNLLMACLMVVTFKIIAVEDSKIVLHAPQEMTTGTDSACELYWSELSGYLSSFKTVIISNKGWVPSQKRFDN